MNKSNPGKPSGKPVRRDGIDPVLRSRARRRALQAIYAWQISGGNAQALIAQFAHEQAREIADLAYFEALVSGVLDHRKDLDEALDPFVDRGIEEVDAIERAALRVAAFELRYRMDVPRGDQRSDRIDQEVWFRTRPHLRQRRAGSRCGGVAQGRKRALSRVGERPCPSPNSP